MSPDILFTVGYDPSNHCLVALVPVKINRTMNAPLMYGYIRFYLADGQGEWQDAGVAQFVPSRVSEGDRLCQAVSLPIQSGQFGRRWRKDGLSRVRAILSWREMPPPNQPGWLPVWGQRGEAGILLASPLWQHNGEMVYRNGNGRSVQDASCQRATTNPASYTRQLWQSFGQNGANGRFLFKLLHDLTGTTDELLQTDALRAIEAETGLKHLSRMVAHRQRPYFDKRYESLVGVGFDPLRSQVNAIVNMHRSSGYGSPVQMGSHEYVAFYLDVGSGWQHIGTAHLPVHDMPEREDVQINVRYLVPYALWQGHEKARVRAVLSWEVAPPAFNPHFMAYWGDWTETTIAFVQTKSRWIGRPLFNRGNNQMF